jgi:HAD superfamily hydrolase (TIGR01509 family)
VTLRYQAALFDVDGTLLDSTEFVLAAVEHTLRTHGRTPPPRSELAAIMGPPLEDCYRRLAPDLDLQELAVTHRAFQRDKLHLAIPFPRATDTLAKLRDAGVRLAAVTTRSRVSSVATLERNGLAPYLEVVISAEDAPRTKPAPDPIFAALDRLGMAPSQAVMIGDTVVDIEAGRNAGTATIGALYGFHGDEIAASRPDYLVRELAEVIPIILASS